MDGIKQSVLSELVNKDQGIENAGKALGIGNDGIVTPVPFSGTDFTGATASLAGTHGYVPAPAAGDQDKVLTGGGSWQVAPGAKLITVDLDTITNVSGSYTGTTNDERVTSDMKPVMLIFGTPSVIRAKPTVTCNNGSITISCSEVVGTTTAQVGVIKVVGDPTVVTSTEFDILNNRIGTLSDLTTTAKTNAVAAINELDSDISTLNSKITSMIEYGNCTYEQDWQGANNRYLRYSIIKDSNGHGICIINGLSDNKQNITGGTAYTVSILPVTSLRDAVAFTNVGKWSIAHGSNELKFTPSSNMGAYMGDIMSISFAI